MENKARLSSKKLNLFLFLFLFWSLAVTQPVMNLLAVQPDFLIAHEIRSWNLILLTVIFNVCIPLLLCLLLILIGFISIRLKEWLARFMVSIMLILLILPLVSSFSNNIAYSIAIIASLFLLYLLVKLEIIRTFALWFSPLSLIFVLSFLFFSPVKQLLPNTIETQHLKYSDDSGPVFVFLFDEFPVLSLLNSNYDVDKTRFPNISNLLEGSTWYRKATTISSATAMAIPAILSGIKPNSEKKRLATHNQYKDNLFSLFSSTHKINAIENTSRMCPENLCKPYIKDPIMLLLEDVLVIYAHYIMPLKKRMKLPPINNSWSGFLREIKNEKKKQYDFSDRLNKFDKFIESFKNYPNNTLHFLHILMPHAPWRILPDESLYAFYESEGVAGTLERNDPAANYVHQWTNDKWATELAWRRQLLQIGAVDSLIGKAINKIKKLGLYEESTIMILADHGGAFIPNLSRRFAHDSNIADIAAIPLIIKYPNQKQGIVDNRFASNIDILPTLLDQFSINTKEEKLDGLSLLSKTIRQKPTPIYQEGNVITEIPINYQSLFDKHLDTKKALFPKDGWSSVYNSFKISPILNTKVEALEIKNTTKDALILQHENLFTQISKDSKYIPAYYRLQSLIDDEIEEILVAFNGLLVSHCFMFKHSEKECAGLINPSVYKSNNDNEFNFRFFSVINKEKGKYVVHELLINSITGAVMERDNDKESLKFNSGKVVPIIKTQPYGSLITRLTNNKTVYKISGWAGNTETGQPAEKIYVFIDNELFTTTHTGLKKPYLYKKYGLKNLIDSGFEVTIPIDQYRELEKHNIRVFASIEMNFVELNYNLSKKHKKLFKAFNPKTNRKIPVNHSIINNQKAKEIEGLNITKIDAFNQEFKKLSSGEWFSIKNHARWLGTSAEVMVPLKNDDISVKITMKAKPLIFPGKLDNQTMIVYANDKPVKTINFTEKASHEILIDLLAENKSGPLIIKLYMPKSASPSDFSNSKDKRKLSFYITDFKINVYNQ